MPITTCLTLNGVAEEAADFYVSVLDDARITQVTPHTVDSAAATGQDEGEPLVVAFEAEGHRFMCLNAGPPEAFSPAMSIVVARDTQEGIDSLWEAFADGGTEMGCGWVTDRFGIAWQVVPSRWPELIGGPDRDGARRAMEAMMSMMKLDIAALQAAYDGSHAPA